MRVNAINCNNILSFQPATDDSNTVYFGDPKQLGGSVDILIGPNGSGKTNFTRILKNIFDGLLIYPCSYTPNSQRMFEVAPVQFDLAKHWSHTDADQQMSIDLILTQTDIDNIWQLWENRERLAQLVSNHSNIIDLGIDQRSAPSAKSEHILRINLNHEGTTRDCELGKCESIVRDYVRYLRFFQQAMEHIHDVECQYDCKKFHDVLTVIHADRSYQYTGMLFDHVNTYQYEDSILQQVQGTRRELLELLHLEIPIFAEVKQKLEECIAQSVATTELHWFQELNNQMDHIIHYRLSIQSTPERVPIVVFEDQLTGQSHSFEELGGGEKTIVHFLFELYARELRDSIMIIDEPEIHLHPHLQYKFLQLLHTTAHQRGMQYLVSTHSPFFVGHATISHLIRFQKNTSHKDSYTQVYKPKKLSIKEKNLITALDYNVAGNIFFVNKAIMVEGPDDHYFFERLIADRGQQPGNHNRAKRYGIFQLNGKHLFPQFKSFLAQYGLETFYIGDWDNIENILHVDYMKYRKKLKKRKKLGTNAKLKHHYEELVDFIQSENPEFYHRITHKIDKLYKEDIYILKEGSVESYVDTDQKGFEHMIDFVDKDFESWKQDHRFESKRAELYDILDKIF